MHLHECYQWPLHTSTIIKFELLIIYYVLLRACLVHCNGHYNVTRINITRYKRSCNVITITIHLFSDNT
jgi:hypothetical protein